MRTVDWPSRVVRWGLALAILAFVYWPLLTGRVP